MYNYDHKIQYNLIDETLKNKTYKQDILTCFGLNENNYNKIALNHKYHIINKDTIKNMNTNEKSLISISDIGCFREK